jgi:hypothetical protein
MTVGNGIALALYKYLVTKTEDYQIDPAIDGIILSDATAADKTITLSSEMNKGQIFVVKNMGSANDVIVDTEGSETIDGAASITLAVDESIMVTNDGSNYFII